MITYALAYCETCEIEYAVAPDPLWPGQYIFFERHKSLEQPTHLCVGGYLCLKGHKLIVEHEIAAFTASGDWIVLSDIRLPLQN